MECEAHNLIIYLVANLELKSKINLLNTFMYKNKTMCCCCINISIEKQTYTIHKKLSSLVYYKLLCFAKIPLI